MAEDFNRKVKAALDVCAPWKNIKNCQTTNLEYQTKQKN